MCERKGKPLCHCFVFPDRPRPISKHVAVERAIKRWCRINLVENSLHLAGVSIVHIKRSEDDKWVVVSLELQQWPVGIYLFSGCDFSLNGLIYWIRCKCHLTQCKWHNFEKSYYSACARYINSWHYHTRNGLVRFSDLPSKLEWRRNCSQLMNEPSEGWEIWMDYYYNWTSTCQQ